MILGIPIPLAMIGAGIVFLLAAVKVLLTQRRIVEVVPYSDTTLQIPAKWDDAEITSLLRRHQNQPAVLSHAVSSIRNRLVLNQDLKTAQQRLKLISSVIELFKLNRELQGVLQDIHLAEKDFEIRQLESELRLEDAQSRLISERKLRQLRQQRDEMVLQKEIGQLGSEIKTIENPPGQQQSSGLSKDQQRRLKRMEIEDKLKELDRLEEEAIKKARDDDDRARIENMYAQRREELREELARYLV